MLKHLRPKKSFKCYQNHSKSGLFFRSDLANGTFAVFFFPCEWSHCLFHTFGLNMTFCHRIVASSVVWWLQRSVTNHRTRVRFAPEVRMHGMEDNGV